MNKINDGFQYTWLMLIIIVIGIVSRLLITLVGFNYDFISYIIVANIVDRGLNVYASTTRYNYGPIWFHILHNIQLLAARDPVVFRYLLVTFLSLVDFGIFAILYRRFGQIAACLFLLNPISIIITGYHNQFGNLALLMGMVAVTLIGNDFEEPIKRQGFFGLVILGLSLATKHVLFIFPVWLAIKQKGISQKIAMMFIPFLIFAIGFIPYWDEGKQGIIQNVFLYKSFNNELFYRSFVPTSIQSIFTSQMIWIFILFIFGFFLRKMNSFDSLLLYTAILVGTSPAITNQYLAVVIPFISTSLNPFTLLYSIIGTFYLFGDSDALHLSMLQNFDSFDQEKYYFILVSLLSLGFVLKVWPKQITAFLKRAFLEIKIKLGYEEP